MFLGRRRGKEELLAGEGGCLACPQTHRSLADRREFLLRFCLAGARRAIMPT